jgi:hypothetical protein
MTKKITFSMIAVFIAAIICAVVFHNPANSYPTGAPSGTTGYTGSPIDGGTTCVSCHNGTAVPVAGIITSTVPVAGYVPGSTYTITATVHGVGNKGFEMFAQNASASQGTFIATSTTHTVGAGLYITHSTDPTNNPQTWTFSWTAPATGVGTITFYGAFAVTEDTTKLSTLTVIQFGTGGIEEKSGEKFVLYPNPASDNLFVNYTLFSNSNVEISIYTIDGKKIATALSKEQSTGNHKEQINLKSLNLHGVYFVDLKVAGQSALQKIVIE